MDARPYKLFGAAERAAAAAAVQERVRPWQAAWLPQDAELGLECAPACELRQRFTGAEPARWTRLAAADGQWLAAHAGEAVQRELALVLCGGVDARTRASYAGSSELARAAAAAALEELARTLLAAPSPETRRGAAAAPEAETWARGSAALALRLSAGAVSLDFVASPAWTLRLLAGRMPRRAGEGNAGGNAARLAARREGVASRRVQLRVLAGAVELDLRAFKALEVGNVIALDARIEQPMTVVVASGSQPALCAARLGSIEGCKAVALAETRA